MIKDTDYHCNVCVQIQLTPTELQFLQFHSKMSGQAITPQVGNNQTQTSTLQQTSDIQQPALTKSNIDIQVIPDTSSHIREDLEDDSSLGMKTYFEASTVPGHVVPMEIRNADDNICRLSVDGKMQEELHNKGKYCEF